MLASEIPEGERAALEAFLHGTDPDAKRDDALELLQQMSRYLSPLGQS